MCVIATEVACMRRIGGGAVQRASSAAGCTVFSLRLCSLLVIISFNHDSSVSHPIRNTAELIVAYRSTSSIDDLRRINVASLAYRLLSMNSNMKAWTKVAAVGIFALWSAPAVAITINDFTVTRNDRFASGYPNGPLVPNTDPSFIGIGYDWSGVGWYMTNGDITYALITPRQMLIANHYLRPRESDRISNSSRQVAR